MEFRKSWRSAILMAKAFALAWAPLPAIAQEVRGFGIDRFEPSEAGSRWFSLDSLDFSGELRPAVEVAASFHHKPQQLYDVDGTHRALIDHQLALRLGASFVFLDRFRVGANLPFYPLQKGEDVDRFDGRYTAPNDAALGDLRLGADARIFGTPGGPLRLGAGLRFWLPIGSADQYTGDGKYKFEPHIDIAGTVPLIEYAGRLSYLHRGNHQSFALSPIGDELGFGLAAGFRLLDDALLLGPELSGAYALSDTGEIYEEARVFASLLVGAKYRLDAFRVGLAAGPGLSHAAGTSRFRAVASLEWLPE